LVRSARENWQGVWLILIALLIAQGGWQAARSAKLTLQLESFSLSGLLRPATTVPSGTALTGLAGQIANQIILVTEAGKEVGYVDQNAAAAAGTIADRPVDASMVAIPAGLAISSELRGPALVAQLIVAQTKTAIIPIVSSNQIIGVVHRSDLPSWQ
jgi:hypothetical protein